MVLGKVLLFLLLSMGNNSPPSAPLSGNNLCNSRVNSRRNHVQREYMRSGKSVQNIIEGRTGRR